MVCNFCFSNSASNKANIFLGLIEYELNSLLGASHAPRRPYINSYSIRPRKIFAKYNNPKQAEALLSGGLVCQKTFSGLRNLRQHSRSFNVSNANVLGTRHQILPKTRNVLCVVKLIHTKAVQTKRKENQSAQIVGDLMLPTTEAVLHIWTKPSGNT